MPTRELIKQIKRIEISTRKAVNALAGGEYQSVFKGRGIEFDEVKQYQPGDQINSIDWKVTARTGVPFVKKFVEERELTVILAVDSSASQEFGSSAKSKKNIIAEVGALLAFSAIRNNDRVGMLIFSDDVDLYLPPRKGRAYGMRVIKELVSLSSEGKGTSILNAMDYIGRVVKSKSIVILISDFLDTGYEKQLSVISKKHDLLLIRINDSMERELPDEGLIYVQDSESGECLAVDASDRSWRNAFREDSDRAEREWKIILRRHKIDSVDINTSTGYLVPLRNFFKKRAERY